MVFDTVLLGGTVIDGSGKEGYRADVGIQGGKIAAVGNLSRALAGRTLDVTGKLVTPGFIDIHRHADVALFREGFADAELFQGLTTIVNGNCGLSIAPSGGAHQEEIFGYLTPVTGMASTHKDNNEIPLRAKEVLPGNRKDFSFAQKSAGLRFGVLQ